MKGRLNKLDADLKEAYAEIADQSGEGAEYKIPHELLWPLALEYVRAGNALRVALKRAAKELIQLRRAPTIELDTWEDESEPDGVGIVTKLEGSAQLSFSSPDGWTVQVSYSTRK